MQNKDQKECSPWVVFWCAVILFGGLTCFSVWYEEHYCEGTATSVKCSYQR